MLLTLLANAVKFTESGKVDLEVSVASGAGKPKALLFRVVDTGVGIDSKALSALQTVYSGRFGYYTPI